MNDSTKALDSLSALQRTVNEASASLRAGLEQMRGTIAAKRQELSALESLPVPIAELKARMRSVMEDRIDYLLAEYGTTFIGALGSPSEKPRWPTFSFHEGKTELLELALYVCAGDELVEQLIARLPAYAAGPPMDDRKARIPELQAELAQLEAGEERMVDGMRANGIEVAHRPEVKERRQHEARAEQVRAMNTPR
jgi:hypothetical protein